MVRRTSSSSKTRREDSTFEQPQRSGIGCGPQPLAGAAVVIYSSDLDEVIALANRVFVLHAEIVREFPRDRDRVGLAMLGLA